MPEKDTDVPKNLKKRAGLLLVVCLIILSTGAAVYFSRFDSTPTVYHHLDGHFSLNQKDGPRVTDQEVFDYMYGYSQFGRVRLVANQKTNLKDWYSILCRTGEAGAASYQLEAGDMVFRFHLALSTEEPENNPSPEIVRLGNHVVPTLEGLPKYDVFVVASDTALCVDVTKEAMRHAQNGKSVAVITENSTVLFLHNSRFDDKRDGPFVRRPSRFWEKYVQPCSQAVRDWL